MKKFPHAAFLAALCLGGVSIAQAGTDLFVGFNDAAGPISAQNDYVIDIGSWTALTNSAETNSGSIDLMSSVAPMQIDQPTFTSTFATAFSADSSELNDVAVGVAGGSTGGNTKFLWQTAPTGITPGTINGTALG